MRTGSRVATAPPPSRLSVAAVPPATAGAPSPLHSPRDLTSHASPPFKAQQPQAGVTRRHSSLIHLCPHYTTDHGMRRRSARALSSSMSALWFANDPPAALDLRPGERGRVHAVPEHAALEELLLRPCAPEVLRLDAVRPQKGRCRDRIGFEESAHRRRNPQGRIS